MNDEFYMSTSEFLDELQVAQPVVQNPTQPNMPPKAPGNIPVGSSIDSGFVTQLTNGTKKKYICNIDYFVGRAEPYFNIVHFLYNAEEGDEVVFNIYSYGGSVETGCMIINAIKNTRATVITRALGICASIAAMIWSCGHVREVSDNAVIMYHMPSGMVYGKTADNEEESRHIQEYFAEFMRSVTKGLLTPEELDKIIGRRIDLFIPASTIKTRLAVGVDMKKEEAPNE
jgi:ATP-dependent protease ClpP protease subunit